MRILETKVYTYAELSDAAKEKARDWYRHASEGDGFYAECVFDDAADIAELMGIDIRQTRMKFGPEYKGEPEYKPTIFFSGFCSQGDGACFEGSWRAKDVKPGAVAKHAPTDAELHRIAAEFERIAGLCPTASFSVKQRGHYSHSGCTSFDFDGLIPEHDDDTARTMAEWAVIEARAESVASDLKDNARSFMDWIFKQLETEWEYQNSDDAVTENIIANEYEFTAEGARS